MSDAPLFSQSELRALAQAGLGHFPHAPGDYEVRGDGLHSGRCAGCFGPVYEGDPYVIRYSTDGTPGGIFHARCEPMGAGWFALDEEAPDL